jgi:hypothetical protein
MEIKTYKLFSGNYINIPKYVKNMEIINNSPSDLNLDKSSNTQISIYAWVENGKNYYCFANNTKFLTDADLTAYDNGVKILMGLPSNYDDIIDKLFSIIKQTRSSYLVLFCNVFRIHNMGNKIKCVAYSLFDGSINKIVSTDECINHFIKNKINYLKPLNKIMVNHCQS